MKVTYHLRAQQPIPLASAPSDLRIDSVDVAWVIHDEQLTGVDLVFREQPLPAEQIQQKDAKITNVRDSAREVVGYRIASYLADEIYIMTGIETQWQDQIIDQFPDAAAETADEEPYFPMVIFRGHGSMQARATVVRKLEGAMLTRRDTNAIAVAHYARATRTADPFDAYEEYFQAIEYFVKDRLQGPAADANLSETIERIEGGYPSFTAGQIKTLREIRTRIVHPHPRSELGHLSPYELHHIVEVRASLSDVQRLAAMLIWGTATPWL